VSFYLGERRAIDGIDIAPRNDQHWKYGQIKDFELYVADNNGEWGAPAYRGQLKHQQEGQSVRFDPIVGRLLRLRVLSTHDAEGKDPMVLGAGGEAAPVSGPVNALISTAVGNIVVSELRLHEFTLPEEASVKRPASELNWQAIDTPAANVRAASAAQPLRMNGVAFGQGFATATGARIDIALTGYPQLFRADLGVDDQCRKDAVLSFQIWGDGRLIYDSGTVKAPGVVKPEIDIRGIKTLSLRTLGKGKGQCGNWANASVTGGVK
jgi:hypothetical protein